MPELKEIRDYQLELLRQVDSVLNADAKARNADAGARVMMQLPTGGGKTHIAGELLRGRLTSWAGSQGIS